jgi:hypothetical protein
MGTDPHTGRLETPSAASPCQWCDVGYYSTEGSSSTLEATEYPAQPDSSDPSTWGAGALGCNSCPAGYHDDDADPSTPCNCGGSYDCDSRCPPGTYSSGATVTLTHSCVETVCARSLDVVCAESVTADASACNAVDLNAESAASDCATAGPCTYTSAAVGCPVCLAGHANRVFTLRPGV